MKVLCVYCYVIMILPAYIQGDTVEEYDSSSPYCFRFTWVGPEYDNTTTFNRTCKTYLEDTNAVGVPCRQPLVITHDGSKPNIDYLWENHKTDVICKRARGQVCAKYSYTFNQEVQNITYMCTKVWAVDEGVVTDGCFTYSVNGYDIELCVCESTADGYKPCNNSPVNALTSGLFIIMLIILFAYR